MGEAKKRGTKPQREQSARERIESDIAEANAMRQEMEIAAQQEREREEEKRQYRLAQARMIEPTDFHSSVAAHGVFEAMVEAMKKANISMKG